MYRAREVSSGKEFALKVLNKDLIRRHDKVLVWIFPPTKKTELTFTVK